MDANEEMLASNDDASDPKPYHLRNGQNRSVVEANRSVQEALRTVQEAFRTVDDFFFFFYMINMPIDI